MHSDWLAIKEASWAWRNPSQAGVINGELVPQKSDLAKKILANDMERMSGKMTRAIRKRWKAKGASA